MASPDSGMDALHEAMLKAFNSADLKAFMDLYTDDCIFMFPDTGIVRGIEGIGKIVGKMLEGLDRLEFNQVSRTFSGDMCAEVGNSSYYKDGQLKMRGLYSMTAINQNGRWKIKYDCNMDEKTEGSTN